MRATPTDQQRAASPNTHSRASKTGCSAGSRLARTSSQAAAWPRSHRRAAIWSTRVWFPSDAAKSRASWSAATVGASGTQAMHSNRTALETLNDGMNRTRGTPGASLAEWIPTLHLASFQTTKITTDEHRTQPMPQVAPKAAVNLRSPEGTDKSEALPWRVVIGHHPVAVSG